MAALSALRRGALLHFLPYFLEFNEFVRGIIAARGRA